MTLYAIISRIFPLTYSAKSVVAVWLGMAVALLVSLASDVPAALVLPALLAGGIVSSIITLGLMAPLRRLMTVISTWGRTGRVITLPEDIDDDIGQLLLRVNLLMARAQRSLDRSWQAEDVDPLTGAMTADGAMRTLRDAGAGWLIGIELQALAQYSRRASPSDAEELVMHIVHTSMETVRQDDIVAQIGEGRFLIFLPGASRDVANRITRRIAENLDIRQAERMGVTVLYGVVPFGGGGDPGESIAEVADELDRQRRLNAA